MTTVTTEPVNFKIYFKNKDGFKKEIRRFCSDMNTKVDFAYVCDKIRQLFPTLRDKGFIISWIDDDMDEIIMTSDEELKIAISVMHNILKLYVKKWPENQGSPASKKGGTFHFNVECDGCRSSILGFRYKCIQCEDYDLCSQCETLGLHPDHCMIRMPQPLQWSSHHGRRLLHHMRKFLKKSGQHFDKEDIPGECPIKVRRCRESSCNYIFNWLAELTSQYNNINEKKAEAHSDDAGSSQETPKQEDKMNSKGHQGICKISKEDIRQLLNSFGLDIDIEISSDILNTSQPDKAEEKKEHKKNVSTDENPSKKFPEEDRKLIEKTNDKVSASDTGSVASQDTTIKKTAATEEWTIVQMYKDDASIISAASSVSSSLNEADKNQVPTSTSLTPSAPEENPSSQMIYPSLPKTEEKVYHPNANIRKAIETMIEMGFSNKDGLLANLLEAENGNIGKVLDILQPINE